MMSPLPDELVIASRGSRLALRQAEIVAGLVRAAHPSIEVGVRTTTTTGDRDERPFRSIGGSGLFTTEVEREVLERRADVAVHSAKDLTAELAAGCAIVCVPGRAPAQDVVVGGHGRSGEERLASLPAGARVGTASMRRRVLVAEARFDVDIVDLRGNLDTRLDKVARGEMDAAVLAAAGLERLGHRDAVTSGSLDPTWWVPAPAQGALAVEAMAERTDLIELFSALSDASTASEIVCERAFAARLEGGCSVPLGCLARVDGDGLVATGFLGAPGGGLSLRDRISGSARDATALGIDLADAILASGGDEVLLELQESDDPVQPSAP
ncbi:hydroxymethylbilane synthase [soil metagenome]